MYSMGLGVWDWNTRCKGTIRWEVSGGMLIFQGAKHVSWIEEKHHEQVSLN